MDTLTSPFVKDLVYRATRVEGALTVAAIKAGAVKKAYMVLVGKQNGVSIHSGEVTIEWLSDETQEIVISGTTKNNEIHRYKINYEQLGLNGTEIDFSNVMQSRLFTQQYHADNYASTLGFLLL